MLRNLPQLTYLYILSADRKGNNIESVSPQVTTNKNELKGSNLVSLFVNWTYCLTDLNRVHFDIQKEILTSSLVVLTVNSYNLL